MLSLIKPCGPTSVNQLQEEVPTSQSERDTSSGLCPTFTPHETVTPHILNYFYLTVKQFNHSLMKCSALKFQTGGLFYTTWEWHPDTRVYWCKGRGCALVQSRYNTQCQLNNTFLEVCAICVVFCGWKPLTSHPGLTSAKPLQLPSCSLSGELCSYTVTSPWRPSSRSIMLLSSQSSCTAQKPGCWTRPRWPDSMA